jgi:hypothetical protein
MKTTCMLILTLLHHAETFSQDGVEGKYYRWDCENSYDNWSVWDCKEEEQIHLYIYSDGTAKRYTVTEDGKTLEYTFDWSLEDNSFTLAETKYQLSQTDNGGFTLKNAWSEHIYHFVGIIGQ